jgi:hypothetical protein
MDREKVTKQLQYENSRILRSATTQAQRPNRPAIEDALNSLNPFPGVVGHLKFTISVDTTGIDVSAEQVEAPQTSVIQQPSA